MPPSEIPQDMRDLLVRLDQRVSDGFDQVRSDFGQVNSKLDKADRRADGLDQRLKDIEIELADRGQLKQRFFDLEDTTKRQGDDLADIKRTFKFGRNLVVASWAVFIALAGLLVSYIK